MEQTIQYIRNLVQEWSLGDISVQDFEVDGATHHNLFIDVGKPGQSEKKECGIWHGHLDIASVWDLYKGTGREPTHFQQASSPHLYYGCGTADMKSGVTAFLVGLRGLPEILSRTRRWIRVALVDLEEDESQGTYAAREHLDMGQWGISTDIPVKGTLDDPPAVYHARPGRAVFDVTIHGKSIHMGAIDPQDPELLPPRMETASATIRGIHLETHPTHPPGFMPPTIVFPKGFQMLEPPGMNSPPIGKICVEVIYTNPSLDLAEIEAQIREQLARALTGGFFVQLRKSRQFPYIKPWYEDPRHPFVQAAVDVASAVHGTPVQRRSCKGTADEPILAHRGIPMVTYPPCATGEHTENEQIDIRSIPPMVSFLHGMAATERNLVDWEP
jgi:acetylornithine deacetylase/succinyl-diaminopimelate desuccinylase-like protein